MSIEPGSAPLQVRHLHASFGSKRILEDVSLAVGPAQITVVLGGSGCGKSTLLKHCVALLPPASGEVLLFGQNVHSADEEAQKQLLSRIGVLFQNGALLSDLTLLQNVMLPMRLVGLWPEDLCRHVAYTKLGWVGLADAADTVPAALSGGMRKRAALARALALEPQLLFCDEPSAGLDPVTAAELDTLLLRVRDELGTSMLVVTHELASIHALADRVLMLEGGKVIAEGTFDAVAAMPLPPVARFFARQGRPQQMAATSLLQALNVTNN